MSGFFIKSQFVATLVLDSRTLKETLREGGVFETHCFRWKEYGARDFYRLTYIFKCRTLLMPYSITYFHLNY